MCKRPQTLAKISSYSVLCYILCLNIRIFYVFYPCQHVQRVLPQPARYMYIVPHCTGTFFFTGKFTGIPWCGKILQFTALAAVIYAAKCATARYARGYILGHAALPPKNY